MANEVQPNFNNEKFNPDVVAAKLATAFIEKTNVMKENNDKFYNPLVDEIPVKPIALFSETKKSNLKKKAATWCNFHLSQKEQKLSSSGKRVRDSKDNPQENASQKKSAKR